MIFFIWQIFSKEKRALLYIYIRCFQRNFYRENWLVHSVWQRLCIICDEHLQKNATGEPLWYFFILGNIWDAFIEEKYYIFYFLRSCARACVCVTYFVPILFYQVQFCVQFTFSVPMLLFPIIEFYIYIYIFL